MITDFVFQRRAARGLCRLLGLGVLGGALALCGSAPSWAGDVTTLSDAMALAYQANPALGAARARLRATDENVAAAESGFRPSLDVVGRAGQAYQNPPIVTGGDKNLYPHDAGLQFSQPIFRGFRTTAGIRAAEADVAAGQAALAGAEQDLLLGVGTAYLDVLLGQATLDLQRRNEDVLREQLAATQGRFGVGEVTKTDISQAEARLQRAGAGRVAAEGALTAYRATFARLVGDMPGNLADPALEPEATWTLNDSVAQAESKNPDVIAASFGRDAAKERLTVAKGSLLPEVKLVGTASRGWQESAMVTGRQDSGTLMAEVTIPLYRSGADYAAARAARENITGQRLLMEEARNRAHERAVSAWAALTAARAAIEAEKAEVQSTDLALHGVREEAKVGTRTTLDILNAEQEALDAKVRLAKAKRDQGVAILSLRAAMGSLTADALNLSGAKYDARQHLDETRGRWIGLD